MGENDVRGGAFLMWKGGTLYFDAVTRESAEFASKATEHPVEAGANVTDHVRNEPARVTLEVFISNEPLYGEDLQGGNTRGGKTGSVALDVAKYDPPLEPTPGSVYGKVTGSIGALISGGPKDIKGEALTFSKSFNAPADVQDILEGLRDDATLIQVITTTRTFDSMAIVHFASKRDKDAGNGAYFSLEFHHIAFVEASLIAAPEPAVVSASTSKERGKQDPKPVTDDRKKSVLATIFGS